MKKTLLITFFIFSTCFVFCEKIKMPEWIIVPSSVYPSDLYLNGTGSGDNREIAELEAVKNLSSIFGQTVISKKVASKKMEQALSDKKIEFTSSGNLNQNITSQIKAENLIGIEIAEYFYNKSEKKWYAIAILQKEKTAAIYENFIKKNDDEVRKALENAEKDLNSFFGYSEIEFALEISEENDNLLKNLYVIDFEKANSLSQKVVSVQTLQAVQKKIADNITIFVNLQNDEDNKIKSSFQDIFSKYGFKTSTSKKERYGLTGKYTSELSKKGKFSYCIYTLDIQFSDYLGKEELFAINLKGREGATSENDAINRTFRVLEKNIESEFRENFDSYINNLYYKK